MKARAPNLPPRAFFSPREFADLAGIHPSTVLDKIHSGKLYAIKLGARIYRIPRAAVVATLYPEMIGEPRFTQSPDIAAVLAADRRRLEEEEEQALAARARRDAREAG